MSQIADQELDRLYYVNVGEKGTFKPGTDPVFNSTPAQIDDIFTDLERRGKKKIVLYFHGGLVSAPDGLDTARRISRYVTGKTDAHPVSFVWQTGVKETIEQNLFTIHKSDFFKRLLVRIVKVAAGRLGIADATDMVIGKGVGTMSDVEIRAELEKDAPFEGFAQVEGAKSASITGLEDWNAAVEASERQEIEAILEEDIEADQKLCDAALQTKPEDEARLMDKEVSPEFAATSKGIISSAKLIADAVEITLRVIRRYIEKRDHDFYPTVVEEVCRQYYMADIGNWLWGSMKDKAGQMWETSDLQGDYQQWAVGYYFIQKLEQYNKRVEGGLTIDLVGHSAGSIVISELLQHLAAQNSKLHFRNVIFMAPAVRCDRFVQHLLTNKRFFDAFRCFTMNDEQEKQDRMVKGLYPYSLLYFISGVLEKESDAHILGLQRHTVGNVPYNGPDFVDIIAFLKAKDSVIYSVTELPGEDGLRSGSVSHGGFDDEDEPTLESIMYLIKQ